MIVTDLKSIDAAEELVRHHKGHRAEKPRSPQEISARYQQAVWQYQSLMRSEKDNREQRLMLYAEIKALGWCQGCDEQKVIQDINRPRR